MAGDRWLTFDCYGTIADWKTCMRAALAPAAGSSADLLLTAYHQAELTLEAEPSYRPYREILACGLRVAARRTGVKLDGEGGSDGGPGAGPGADPEDPALAFVRAWPGMALFDDTAPALRSLA
ncbi:MAG: hypothetical protein J2P26_08730, partial [Nocardiopsaceae bacterium]|nr:hypothetical protein [Nocardiopsaceae bacterium]